MYYLRTGKSLHFLGLEKQDVYDLFIKVCIKYSFRVLSVSGLPGVECVFYNMIHHLYNGSSVSCLPTPRAF